MAGQVRSRIWTSAIDMITDHIKFPDKAYAEYNGNKQAFDDEKLGAHFEERKGEQERLIDPSKYIKFISDILHKYDSRSLVYGMVHDQDIKYDENGNPVYRNGKRVMDVDAVHLHLLIHFSKAVTLPIVSKLTGIAPNLMERGKVRGRYAFSSAMAYLIHALQPTKHQYKPEDVINGEFNNTVDNESGLYEDYYLGHKDEWESRRTAIEKKARNLDFQKIYEDTMLGKYSRDDLVGGSEELFKLYVEHKKQLDEARAAYLDRKFILYNKGVNNGSIKIQTLFIFGEAGQGKTKLAKSVCDGLVELSNGKWRTFQPGSQHPFDEYDGQELILLDDIRANALNATDWLHLVDPHNNGVMSARYHDAKPMPRLLIITTTTPAHEFFAYTKGLGADEPLDQFLRRIQWSAKVVDINSVNLGHKKELGETKKLKLPDTKLSYSETTNNYGRSTRTSYKPGNEKTYKYAFEDWITGSFDEVSDSLIRYYGTYFGLVDDRNNLGLIAQHQPTGSALPVVSDGDKWPLKNGVNGNKDN